MIVQGAWRRTGSEQALPSSAFGRPELNAFLFASVGEDKNGIELTVMSALLRLGLVGWFFLLSYLTTNPVYESTSTVSAPN